MSTEIASRLWNAWKSGATASVSPGELPETEADALEVQAQLIEVSGHAVAGWKVGAGIPAAQQKIGASGPFCGPVFEHLLFHSPAEVVMAPAHGPKIETEVVFRLNKDLAARDTPYTEDEVLDAVGSVHPGFELVGSRITGETGRLPVIGMLCDGGNQVGLVVGAAVSDWRKIDFMKEGARLYRNDEEIASGTGESALLTGPVSMLVTFANLLKTLPGSKATAGQYISTGTLTGMQPVEAGDRFRAEFDTLGSISVRNTA